MLKDVTSAVNTTLNIAVFTVSCSPHLKPAELEFPTLENGSLWVNSASRHQSFLC